MNLGDHLFQARKKKGLSQENVAEKLGVSRQTVSKWELNETLPDIRQAKSMATLYGLTLDELQKQYGYTDLNAMLVLKDILAAVWKNKQRLQS